MTNIQYPIPNTQYPISNIQPPTTAPSFLQNDGLRFIFFGGKGGVGKTTAAVATALYLARQRPEERILVVSTDPAHSLGDSLGQPIGGQAVPIKGVDNLFALELDSERLLAEWKQEYDPMIARIADRGTYFDVEDINNFLLLTLPGMDEAMAIMQIMGLTEEQQYDRVVVDTAPTGHTLRLLALPAQMKLWIQVMDRLMEKHRFIVRSLVGRYSPDEADHWLVKMDREIRHVASSLQDAGVTEFIPVTIPEEMAIYETRRLVSALREHPLAVRNLVINQVVNHDPSTDPSTSSPPRVLAVAGPGSGHDGRCPTCRRRGEDQAGALAQIGEGFAGLRLLTVPQLSHEVRGMKALTEFGQMLAEDGTAEEDKETRRQGDRETRRQGDRETRRQGDKETRRQGDLSPSPCLPLSTSPPLSFGGFGSAVLTRVRGWWSSLHVWLGSLWARRRQEDERTRGQGDLSPSPPLPLSLSPPSARFIMVGGKGGVGKTTTAAATALYLARQRPDQRVLVFSTDPAHSMGDAFDQPVGAQVTPIEPYDNLQAYEIDAVQLLEDFRREYHSGGGQGQQARDFREEVSSQMLDLIPPGLDELMALLEIMELAEEGQFDVFILDTAPTGHLIRFLETPELAQNWLKAAARMLLKYKNTVRLGRLAELVVKCSRQVRILRQQLVDSAQTEFVAVTIPEAMAVAESERLLRCLDGLNVTCRQILVNKVTQVRTEPCRSNSACPFCAARCRQEQGIIRQLMADHPDLRLAQTPQLPHHVRGIEDLVEFGEMLYA